MAVVSGLEIGKSSIFIHAENQIWNRIEEGLIARFRLMQLFLRVQLFGQMPIAPMLPMIWPSLIRDERLTNVLTNIPSFACSLTGVV